jgi:hypothetical protein
MLTNKLSELYNGFYIEKPAGNNAFSFEKRKNKKIFVAPLIHGNVNDLKVGQKIAFSETADGIEKNKVGLDNFIYSNNNGKDIFIFDNHNHAFFFWMYALKEGRLKKGSTLVHIDQHTDMREPSKYFDIKAISGFNLKDVFEYTNYELNVGNFIKPALALNLFSNVEIIDRSFAFEKQPEGHFVLDIDIDIFSNEMDYIDYDFKINKIRSYIKKAKFITIAASPYFVDLNYAIKIIKELFSQSG